MSCENVLYILSYFEGKIDIYECVYYCKDILKTSNESLVLNKYISYLESSSDSVNFDGDYLFEIEEYLLNLISSFLKFKNFDIDIDYLDIGEIKSYILRCS